MYPRNAMGMSSEPGSARRESGSSGNSAHVRAEATSTGHLVVLEKRDVGQNDGGVVLLSTI